MKTNRFSLLAAGILLALAFVSCSGKDGSSCIVKPKENAEDGFDVFCDGENVGELLNGEADCIFEPKPQTDSLLVICNGELAGTFRSGEGCSVAEDADNTAYLKMTCGSGETETEKTWPKALCGAIAYDPEKMACSGGALGFSFTDVRDGKVYKAVVIDTLTWMAENLNYAGSSSSVGKCYNDNAINCATYGRLYDWAEAMGIDDIFNGKLYAILGKKKGLCPAGWHLPDNGEWIAMISAIGGTATAGTKLKATNGWSEHKKTVQNCITVEGSSYDCSIPVSGNGTDDYGFSALPGGHFNSEVGNISHWWNANEDTDTQASSRIMYYNQGSVSSFNDTKSNSLSVRCIKD
ncbi:MAG: fibrobacter succinogenes major paralogous domain-containing protein [Fibromonadaceae bacterium]|nr:fibrobacter succinogenes major paralogous domain-containing protein [Fibromonadaceae bacterium]